MDKFWEDILLGIENTTEAEWDKLFSDFEKDGYINEEQQPSAHFRAN